MTKKIEAKINSITDREEYPAVEALKRVRITRHNIISANRRLPFWVHKKLVQVVQHQGADVCWESAMVGLEFLGAGRICLQVRGWCTPSCLAG